MLDGAPIQGSEAPYKLVQ